MGRKLTTEEFIEKGRQVHKNKYDYSKVDYVNAKTKVCIICPEHGEFWQKAGLHLFGYGCQKCTMIKHWNTRGRVTTEEFINKAKQVHGNKYDYSKVEYVNNRTKVCIICPEHGEFWQKPNDHLNGEGCPRCRGSRLETKIATLLENNNINYIREKTFDWLKNKERNLFLDFYLPDYDIAIECQGVQHYMPLRYSTMKQEDADILYEVRLVRDNIKKEACDENKIKLLFFTDKIIFDKWVKDKTNVFYNKEEILNVIKNG